jgi:hypothetical protein
VPNSTIPLQPQDSALGAPSLALLVTVVLATGGDEGERRPAGVRVVDDPGIDQG